jgi:hypothetical protein
LDPLDKVYSVLSLGLERIRNKIIPDYAVDVTWLYCHATKLQIEFVDSNNILRGSMAETSLNWVCHHGVPISHPVTRGNNLVLMKR